MNIFNCFRCSDLNWAFRTFDVSYACATIPWFEWCFFLGCLMGTWNSLLSTFVKIYYNQITVCFHLLLNTNVMTQFAQNITVDNWRISVAGRKKLKGADINQLIDPPSHSNFEVLQQCIKFCMGLISPSQTRKIH